MTAGADILYYTIAGVTAWLCPRSFGQMAKVVRNAEHLPMDESSKNFTSKEGRETATGVTVEEEMTARRLANALSRASRHLPGDEVFREKEKPLHMCGSSCRTIRAAVGRLRIGDESFIVGAYVTVKLLPGSG